MTSELRVLTVNFHFVREADPKLSELHERSPRQFSDQLDELDRRATFLPPKQMIAWLEGLEDLEPRDYFNMTFDDGLKDHPERVAPELEARGWNGFFFSNTLPWQGELCAVHRFQLLRAGVPMEDLIARFMDVARNNEGLDVPPLDAVPEAAARTQYRYDNLQTARFKYMLNFTLSPETVTSVQKRLFADFIGPEGPIAEDLYMTPKEAQGLVRKGHVVGLHSHRHEPLAVMDPSELEDDLTLNAELLADAIGEPAKTVSYPYGSPSAVAPNVIQTCRELGLTTGFTMKRGYITGRQDPLILPRVDTNDAPGGKSPKFDFGD